MVDRNPVWVSFGETLFVGRHIYSVAEFAQCFIRPSGLPVRHHWVLCPGGCRQRSVGQRQSGKPADHNVNGSQVNPNCISRRVSVFPVRAAVHLVDCCTETLTPQVAPGVFVSITGQHTSRLFVTRTLTKISQPPMMATCNT